MEDFISKLNNMFEGVNLYTTEEEKDLNNRSKEYLIKKILYLQNKLNNTNELNESIKQGIKEGLKTVQGEQDIKLATACYVDNIQGYITDKVDCLKTNLEDFKQSIKNIQEFNNLVEKFKKYDIVSRYNDNNIQPYNIFDDIPNSLLEKDRQRIQHIVEQQYNYDLGFNDCLKTCRSLKKYKLIKQLSERNLYRGKNEEI